MARILLIDDDDDLTHFLRDELSHRGHEVHCLAGPGEAPRLLREARPPFRLVLLDVGLPGASGIDVLKEWRAGGITVPVVLVTGNDTSEPFIQALQLNVPDYVIKPEDYQSLCARLEPIIERVLAVTGPVPAVSLPAEARPRSRASNELVGRVDGPMGPVYKLIAQFAPADDPVLILGETGTGKELVARALHTHSGRKDGPYLALNCAALPENLLETELFGHEKGAFSGADKLRKGKFEHADGGTIFLDEIGDMPLSLQPKLLRVIQEQCFERVGGNEPIRVNVRFLAATHCDLETAIKEKTFRQDLYYRLNGMGMPIRLPRLCERGADLPLLAAHFLRRAAEERGRTAPAVADGTLACLRAYHWPGNVRELEGVMRYAFGACRGPQVLPEHLPTLTGPAAGDPDLAADLRRVIARAFDTRSEPLYPLLDELLQRELLRLALERLDGNQTRAAERIGIGRTRISALTRQYGMR